jgi:hypothetical protein
MAAYIDARPARLRLADVVVVDADVHANESPAALYEADAGCAQKWWDGCCYHGANSCRPKELP